MKINDRRKNKMSQQTLEVMPGIVSGIKICDLKNVAENDVAYHPEKRMLIENWDVCLRCSGYDTSCPGYRVK
jgi:hypothetical protein